MPKMKALNNMTEEELVAHAQELHEQKVAIKEREREVAAMLEARAAVAHLSASAAKLVSITIAGGVEVAGDVSEAN